jgi:hypothetical protein
MSDTKITWYSMNRELEVEQHEAIGLDEARNLVDRYLARANEKFSSAEDAIAATLFGFSRSESEFIEIGVNSPTRISYKLEIADPEASWFHKLFKGVYRHEEELHSREELVQKIQEFFTTPVQEIKRQLENR